MGTMSTGTESDRVGDARPVRLEDLSAYVDKKVLVTLAEHCQCYQDGIAQISGFFKDLSQSNVAYWTPDKLEGCFLLQEVEYHSHPGRYMMGSRNIYIHVNDVTSVELNS